MLFDLIKYQIRMSRLTEDLTLVEMEGDRSARRSFTNCQFFKNKLLIMYDLQKRLTNCSIKYNISNGSLTQTDLQIRTVSRGSSLMVVWKPAFVPLDQAALMRWSAIKT